MSKFQKSLLLVFILLVIDQFVKLLVKTNMSLYETIPVFGEWFKIYYVENQGMAFGWKFGGDYGKLILSVFRLLAIIGIIWYLFKISKSNIAKGARVSISFILAGAIGNMIDSAFYGIIFNEATFLHGSVVDMLQFPIIRNAVFPSWIPFFGGDTFTFFSPIFNIADVCVTTGVALFIIFRKKFVNLRQEISEPDSQVAKG